MSLQQVREFHEAFGHPVVLKPTIPNEDRRNLRTKLIIEEMQETFRDALNDDLVKFADGLADLTVVINGALLEYGFAEVTPGGEEFYAIGTHGIRIPDIMELLTLGNHMRNNFRDLWDANTDGNTEMAIDALLNMKFWVSFLASSWGIPLDEIVSAVHKANMSKLGEDGKPIYREDGKILKGPNFAPPEEDIEAILKAHGAEL